jgi:ADP-ribose pyrophosphatase
MIESWQLLGEKLVYNGHRKILARTFRLPDGREEVFEIVVSPASAAVLGLTSDQKVVIAKQFRPGQQKVLMELPGGGVDPGGDHRETVEREFLEETGYTGDFTYIGQCYDSAYSTWVRHHYVATNCHKVADQKLDPNENIEVVELPLDEFKALIRSGQLTDAILGYAGLDYLGLL